MLDSSNGVIVTTATPRRREGLTAVSLDGETVLYDRSLRAVHRLNSSASFIWQLCDGSRTVEEITALVAGTFERTPKEISPDVIGAMADLASAGLLDPYGASAAGIAGRRGSELRSNSPIKASTASSKTPNVSW